MTKKTVYKSNISKFINNSDLDGKIETLVTKVKLKTKRDRKIEKLQTYNSSLFCLKILYQS